MPKINMREIGQWILDLQSNITSKQARTWIQYPASLLIASGFLHLKLKNISGINPLYSLCPIVQTICLLIQNILFYNLHLNFHCSYCFGICFHQQQAILRYLLDTEINHYFYSKGQSGKVLHVMCNNIQFWNREIYNLH